jgi:uncharacterized protein YbjT (DUF2867 family)
MSAKKIIAVVGATGAQGGGLVRAIAADQHSGFAARALTRDVDSEKARDLQKLGVEVVAADVDDRMSLERAFKGAYGAFCVTFFWNHFSPERELADTENLAAAAQAAGLKHVIWSTLEDTRKRVPLDDERMPTLMGKYKVPHFDAKGEANGFFLDRGVPTTFLVTSAHLTGAQMAASFTNALGVEVSYNEVAPETYRSFGFPGAEDLGNMFQFDRDFETECLGARPSDGSLALNASLQDFDSWLAHNKSKIPLER